MKLNYCLYLPLLILLVSCKQNQFSQAEKSVQEIKAEGPVSNADIIRNPVTAEGPQDTVNLAKMAFSQSTFNFGEVPQGDVVEHIFEFTNTGKVPLVINDARSTCGCTVPTWPKEAIEPGQSGKIRVEFNTKGKYREQRKPITITANTYPARTVVYLEGFVQPDETTN